LREYLDDNVIFFIWPRPEMNVRKFGFQINTTFFGKCDSLVLAVERKING